MVWCGAAITLTQSRTHPIAWLCTVVSSFPTTTPRQPSSAKLAVLLFPHHPPCPYRHLVSPRSHPLSVTCRMNFPKQMPTSNRNMQERNEKWPRNNNTNENLAQKPTPSNLPLESPPLIFHPICSRCWSSGVQLVLIVQFTVGADSPKSRPPHLYLHPGSTRRCSRWCVLRVEILRVHFSQSYGKWSAGSVSLTGLHLDFDLPRSRETLHDLPHQLCQLFQW